MGTVFLSVACFAIAYSNPVILSAAVSAARRI
jgi:hypothetical protein